jgi:hypothetical protein
VLARARRPCEPWRDVVRGALSHIGEPGAPDGELKVKVKTKKVGNVTFVTSSQAHHGALRFSHVAENEKPYKSSS